MGRKLACLQFLVHGTKVKGFKSIRIHKRRLGKMKNRSILLPQFGLLDKDMRPYKERHGFPPFG